MGALEKIFVFCFFAYLCEGHVERLDGRIVNGSDVSINNYPYQISLQSRGYHMCGGSILTPLWILTAAHCVDGEAVINLSIRAGSTNKESGGQVRAVFGYAKHPQYNNNTYDNDIAIIKLKKPLELKTGVLPVTMATYLPPDNTPIYLSGWGALATGANSPVVLQGVDVKSVNKDECNAKYDNELTANMWCAGADGKDTCQGDSGGPAVIRTATGLRVLVGVVSWGRGCAAPGYPGVYASVPFYRSWIRKYAGI